MGAHGFVQTFANVHGWYHIDTPIDCLRATLWCLSNLVAAIGYLLISIEIWHWRTALPFASASLLMTLFIIAITLCGLSHLALLFVLQTAPWWILFLFVPIAVVAAITIVLMRRDRAMILAVFESVSRALGGEAPPVAPL